MASAAREALTVWLNKDWRLADALANALLPSAMTRLRSSKLLEKASSMVVICLPAGLSYQASASALWAALTSRDKACRTLSRRRDAAKASSAIRSSRWISSRGRLPSCDDCASPAFTCAATSPSCDQIPDLRISASAVATDTSANARTCAPNKTSPMNARRMFSFIGVCPCRKPSS